MLHLEIYEQQARLLNDTLQDHVLGPPVPDLGFQPPDLFLESASDLVIYWILRL